MNPDRILLKLSLDRLNVPVELDTFSKRFNIQKKVYLAQVCGVDMGHRFGWYIRGPYSQGLTADAFALREEIREGDTEFEGYVLDPDLAERLDRAKDMFSVPEGFQGTSDDWLELLASLHYLRHITYRPTGTSREFDHVYRVLVKSKPKFKGKKGQARMAWDRLDEFGLIESKTLDS